MTDDAPERGTIEDTHERAADIEIAATVKLRKTLPTTIAGVMAVTAYFVEHRDRYPVWAGGEIEQTPEAPDFPEDRSFEDSLIRNVASALARIRGLSVGALAHL